MAIASSSAPSHAHRVERVLWIVFVLNLAVAAAKFFYGLASGSASMQADGIHSVFDSVGNIVGLVSIALASRPADKGHPYGHSKFETYGSLVIGVLLLVAAFEVGSGAVAKLTSGDFTAQVGPASFAVMVGTLAVNLGVTAYERRQGRLLRSEILAADAAHTLSDAFVSVGVIAGLALVAAGFPAADPVMALIVTAAIVVSAIGVFRAALRTLSDEARLPSEDVEATVSAIPGIRGVHQVRTRGTEAEVYCDLHILVDPAMTVRDAHALGDAAEAALKRRFPAVKQVLVHIEPEDDEGADEEPIAGE
ncbi:MAG: cation transporter [Eggerthellaceae bacterium]|nr:cation transporter [Eggerthellaceae bacterium]